MKVGLILTSPGRSASVRHVMASVRDALAADCELLFLPPSMAFEPEAEQDRLAGEFLSACDAIVGIVNPAVLRAREKLGSTVPYLLLMLGTMPRGAHAFRRFVPQLTSRDVLIVNSRADQALCRKFFPNAFAPIVPLAYDDRSFHPIDDATRAEVRDELGLPPGARVLLYSGRVIPEKNLPGVLRVMSVLMRTTPDVHLVLAGELGNLPFAEFGVAPVNFPRSLTRAAEKLSLPPDRLLFAGAVSTSELRELYGIADLAINLTLHHDENFGLSQVEAMACGTPVVGTAWGGLKDTIAHGETGFQVGTSVTPLGVKVDWWEAANRVQAILGDGPLQERFREAASTRASHLYSSARLREGLMALLLERTRADDSGDPEPLRTSAFAEELWTVCDPSSDLRPRYLRSDRAMELYRELIEPYAGSTDLTIAPEVPLSDEQMLSLAVPVASSGDRVWPEDPLYPLEIRLPAHGARSVRKALRVLSSAPVMAVREMRSHHLGETREALAALDWLLGQGLILRTREVERGIDPRAVPGAAAAPLFSARRVRSEEVDFVFTG